MLFRSLLCAVICAFLVPASFAVAQSQQASIEASADQATVSALNGVTVFLRDGREFTGRLIEETPHKITIETTISGITVEMTFGANEVQSIERYEDTPERPRQPEREQEASEEAEGGWVRVPAHGTIGVELTKNFFETCVEKASNAGAEVIIFELKSPGGYLYSLDEIYEGLQEARDDLRIIFYVDDECFSAAALLCITSDAFYVGPNASFGSAVVIQDNDKGGVDAVNAKYASAQASIWRTRAERRGRPGLLVNAMMLVDTEVWADKSQSPWRLFTSRPGGDSRAELVVGDRAILSMTANEAVSLGAADDARDNFDHLLRELDLENPEREAVSGESQARTIIRSQQRRINDLESRIEFIDAVIDRINEGIEDESITVDSFRRDLIRVRSSLDRVRREMEQTDFLRFHCLLHGLTYEVIDEYKKSIDEALRMLR